VREFLTAPGGTLSRACGDHRDQRGDLLLRWVAPNDAKYRPPLLVVHAFLRAI
jgi:hypothetical protein